MESTVAEITTTDNSGNNSKILYGQRYGSSYENCSFMARQNQSDEEDSDDDQNNDVDNICDPINQEGKEEEQLEFLEGGWGWVIVSACFFNSFILDGIGSSFGVLYPHVHLKFNASAFMTSFAGSMFGAYLIMGSIAAFLIKKFGFRAVSFTGGVISCIGLVGASCSSNIYLFLLCFGVVGGAGVGLVYLPSMVIVNGYFNKRRGITNGIISSGSGVGLLVMAPVTNALLDRFSLNGCLLILAGVLFNICVFSSCFRHPNIYHSANFKQTGAKKVDVDTEDNTEDSSINSYEQIDPVTKQVQHTKDSEVQPANDLIESCPQVLIKCSEKSHKQLKPETFLAKKDKFLLHELRSNPSLMTKLPSQDTSSKRSLHSFSTRQLPDKQNMFTHHSTYALAEKNKLHPYRSTRQPTRSNYNLFGIKNSFERLPLGDEKHAIKYSSSVFTDIGINSYLTGSISRLMEIHNQQFASSHQLESKSLCHEQISTNIIGANAAQPTHKDNCHLSTGLKYYPSHSSIHSHTTQQDNISLSEDIQQEHIGYNLGQLLQMLPFHLFCLGACLIQFGYPVPGMFLADLATTHGISAQFGAIMISLIGSFNVIGRLLGGALANLNINPLRLNNIAMLVAAGLCFLCPLFTTSWALCIFASLYGFLLGFFPPLQPLIIVKYFGIGSLASTFGFVTTLKGFAGLIGPPLAGWIYDLSHDYSISIASAGVAFLLSVVVNEILVHIIDRKLK